MGSRRVIIFLIFAYFLYCIYLVCFSGINLKEIDNETWIENLNYSIGLGLCLPAAVVIEFLPESMSNAYVAINFLVSITGAIVALSIVLLASKFIPLKSNNRRK